MVSTARVMPTFRAVAVRVRQRTVVARARRTPRRGVLRDTCSSSESSSSRWSASRDPPSPTRARPKERREEDRAPPRPGCGHGLDEERRVATHVPSTDRRAPRLARRVGLGPAPLSSSSLYIKPRWAGSMSRRRRTAARPPRPPPSRAHDVVGDAGPGPRSPARRAGPAPTPSASTSMTTSPVPRRTRRRDQPTPKTARSRADERRAAAAVVPLQHEVDAPGATTSSSRPVAAPRRQLGSSPAAERQRPRRAEVSASGVVELRRLVDEDRAVARVVDEIQGRDELGRRARDRGSLNSRKWASTAARRAPATPRAARRIKRGRPGRPGPTTRPPAARGARARRGAARASPAASTPGHGARAGGRTFRARTTRPRRRGAGRRRRRARPERPRAASSRRTRAKASPPSTSTSSRAQRSASAARRRPASAGPFDLANARPL